MLVIFRRHLKSCPHTSRKYRRCKCPIHVEGSLAGEKIRRALDLSNWEVAQELVRQWEADGGTNNHTEKVTITEAVEKFFIDAQARHLKESTIKKLSVLLRKQFIAYCQDKGLRCIHELTVDDLREFRAVWKDGAISSQKKLERLRSFFRFCLISKWINENPALGMSRPKISHPPTLPFTKEEMQAILCACEKYPDSNRKTGQANAKKLRALVLLLRYSGMRIGDVITLSEDRLKGDKLFLYTQKTGVPVYLPLPEFVLDSLREIEKSSRKYYFWTGNGKITTRVGNLARSLSALFSLAGVEGGHAHRFRDTFAVELLQKGVPLEQVAVLLGHSSIKITEKHYAPWVKSRQEQLEESVRKSWDSFT
jgi:integrase/recombinase XerD